MSKIFVGRVGEDLHEFSFRDVMDGAVQESGLFPELYKSSWPVVTSGALVTGVDRKLQEHEMAMRYDHRDFPLFMPPSLLPKALEDSKEAESNQIDITTGKIYKSFLNPVRNHAASLKRSALKGFYNDLANRARVGDVRHIVAIGDDRNSIVDPRLKEPLYGHLRDHWNAQVREIFEEGYDIPGARVKETDSAHYGVANSVYLLEKAVNELSAQGEDVQMLRRMDTTMCFMPLVAGALPLPESGLVIRAETDPQKMKPLDNKMRRMIEKGRILTYDEFNMASGYGLNDGVTLADIKALEEEVGVHPFLAEQHSPLVAMRAFAEIVGIPKQGSTENMPARPAPKANRKARTVVMSARMLSATPSDGELGDSVSLPVDMKMSKAKGRLTSLRKLEEITHSGQAFVVQDPKKFDVTDQQVADLKKTYGDRKEITKKNIRLLRRLETDLVFSYVITMSTQAGAPNHIGRAHMVEKSYFQENGLWHPDFSNLSLTGDTETEAYRLFKNMSQLHEGLKITDPTTYRHNVNVPQNDFVSEKDIFKMIPQAKHMFRVGGYATASAFLDRAYKDPRKAFYALSKMGAMTITGGGVRAGMLGLNDGPIQANDEMYGVFNLGIRSESDVSPLEGNVEDWIRGRGYGVGAGSRAEHIHFLNAQMHILKLERLLQRQEPIAGLSHVSMVFPGGKGTVVENALGRLHNASVKVLGEGIFPHYSSNKTIIPIVQVDHKFENMGKERALFDILNAPYTTEEQKLFEQHRFIDARDDAVEFVRDYAEGREVIAGQKLNFSLREQDNKCKNYVHGESLAGGPAVS